MRVFIVRQWKGLSKQIVQSLSFKHIPSLGIITNQLDQMDGNTLIIPVIEGLVAVIVISDFKIRPLKQNHEDKRATGEESQSNCKGW